MKKVFLLILAVMLLLGLMGSAGAYEEEITFENIPWGSSIEEVKAILNDLYGEYDCEQYEGSNGFVLDTDGDSFSDWYSYMDQTTSLFVQLKDVEMLGYPLENIRFVFAVKGEESKLITIALGPKAPDLSGKSFDKMVGTFVDDIIARYGQPKKNNSSQFILLGGENTAIYMYKGMDDFIWYGRTDAVETISTIGSGETTEEPDGTASEEVSPETGYHVVYRNINGNPLGFAPADRYYDVTGQEGTPVIVEKADVSWTSKRQTVGKKHETIIPEDKISDETGSSEAESASEEEFQALYNAAAKNKIEIIFLQDGFDTDAFDDFDSFDMEEINEIETDHTHYNYVGYTVSVGQPSVDDPIKTDKVIFYLTRGVTDFYLTFVFEEMPEMY